MPRTPQPPSLRSADTIAQVLESFTCPACGHPGAGATCPRSGQDRIRIFCDCCGAFVTIELSHEAGPAEPPA